MLNNLIFKLTQKFPVIAKFVHSHDGYLPEEESDEDYIFGAEKLRKEVLVENGQWMDLTPEDEIQKGRKVETMGCTGYALNNCLEMIAKKKWEADWNKSDRFINKMTGTTTRGNGMRNVMDITRKWRGLVNESSWSWDRETFTWAKYYENIPPNIQKLGKDFLKEYDIGYERVLSYKSLMMNALKYSPLYVAGFAWYKQGNLYKSYSRANHAFTIVGYVEGSHWIAYDSYSPHIKHLDWNFEFSAVYTILLGKRVPEFNQSKIDYLLSKGFKFIMRTDKMNGGKGQIYELTTEGLSELSEQDKKDWAVRALAEKKDLTGISELDYYKLIC